MSTTATSPLPTATREKSSLSKPSLLSPVGGTPVDGAAAHFMWEHVSDATEYQLQIAPETNMEAPVFDAGVGRTNSFTLYGMLAEDGRSYYWRVRARIGDGWSEWTSSAECRAVTDDELSAYREKVRQEERRAAQEEAAAADIPAEAPHLTGVTSNTETLVFILLFVLMIVALVAILLYFGYEARDAATFANSVVLPAARMGRVRLTR